MLEKSELYRTTIRGRIYLEHFRGILILLGKGTPHNPTFYYELVDMLDPTDGLYDKYVDAMKNNGNDTFTQNGAFHNEETIGNANGPWLWKPGPVVGGTVNSKMWDSPAELASEMFEPVGAQFSTNYLKKMDKR